MPALSKKRRRGGAATSSRLPNVPSESDADDDHLSLSSAGTSSTLSAETRKAPKLVDTDEISPVILTLVGVSTPIEPSERANLASYHEFNPRKNGDVILKFLAQKTEAMLLNGIKKTDNQLLLLALADFGKLAEGPAALLNLGVGSNGNLPESYNEEFQPSADIRNSRMETLYRFLKITYNEPRSPLSQLVRSIVQDIEDKCAKLATGVTIKQALEELTLHRTVSEIASFFFSFASADDAALVQLMALSLAFVYSDSSTHTSRSSDESDDSDEDRVETQRAAGQGNKVRTTRLRSNKEFLVEVKNLLSLSRMSAVLILRLQQEKSQVYGKELYELQQEKFPDANRIHELEQRFLESSPSPIKYIREKLLDNETVPYLQMLYNFLAAGAGPEWRRRL